MSLSSDADQAARLDQSLSLGDLTICPAPVLDSGEAASVTRDLLSDILEDVIKEEAVPDSEPESTEKLGEEEARLEERPGVWYGDSNTAVAEINSTGPENTLCPAWDHKYAKPSSSEEAVPNQELENDCTSPAITVRSLGPEQRPVSVESDHMSLDITVDQLENPRDDSYNKEEAVPDSEPVSTEKLGEDEARLAEKPGVWDGHSNTAPPAPAPKPLVGLAPVPPVASMIVGMSAYPSYDCKLPIIPEQVFPSARQWLCPRVQQQQGAWLYSAVEERCGLGFYGCEVTRDSSDQN